MESVTGRSKTQLDLASTPHGARPRSRNKKDLDPFLQLPDDIQIMNRTSPNAAVEKPFNDLKSLLADLILTPLNMITFLVSLCVVDRQQRKWRLSQHEPDGPAHWYQSTARAWLDPEPYQNAGDSTWSSGGRGAVRPAISGRTQPHQGWFARKKHRALAKMEITDAMELRGRVLVALLAWLLFGMLLLAYACRRLYKWLDF